MSGEEREYGGKTIRCHDEKDEATVIIDGTAIEVLREEQGFYTVHLPYENYDSLDRLAEDLVDQWAVIGPAVRKYGGDDR